MELRTNLRGIAIENIFNSFQEAGEYYPKRNTSALYGIPICQNQLNPAC